eukprot:105488_1
MIKIRTMKNIQKNKKSPKMQSHHNSNSNSVSLSIPKKQQNKNTKAPINWAAAARIKNEFSSKSPPKASPPSTFEPHTLSAPSTFEPHHEKKEINLKQEESSKVRHVLEILN